MNKYFTTIILIFAVATSALGATDDYWCLQKSGPERTSCSMCYNSSITETGECTGVKAKGCRVTQRLTYDLSTRCIECEPGHIQSWTSYSQECQPVEEQDKVENCLDYVFNQNSKQVECFACKKGYQPKLDNQGNKTNVCEQSEFNGCVAQGFYLTYRGVSYYDCRRCHEEYRENMISVPNTYIDYTVCVKKDPENYGCVEGSPLDNCRTCDYRLNFEAVSYGKCQKRTTSLLIA